MTWGCEKMTLGNDQPAWLEIGKTTTFKPKVIIYWSELSINSILSDIKKTIILFKIYVIKHPFFQIVCDSIKRPWNSKCNSLHSVMLSFKQTETLKLNPKNYN